VWRHRWVKLGKVFCTVGYHQIYVGDLSRRLAFPDGECWGTKAWGFDGTNAARRDLDVNVGWICADSLLG
jgi:hypothetical protein